MNNEWDGGSIERTCPHCGQFVRVPQHYHVKPLEVPKDVVPYIWPTKCYANSYCKRCKKKVELGVVFI